MTTRIYFLDNAKVDASQMKVEKAFIVNTGQLKSAKLTVISKGSWRLAKVHFNEKSFEVPIQWGNPLDTVIGAREYRVENLEVADALKNSQSNTLILIHDALPWSNSQVTAYLDIDTTGIITSTPDPIHEIQKAWDWLASGTWQVILILVLLAFIGYVLIRLFGGFF